MGRNPEATRRCVFFDRDGIVNRSPGAGYVTRWEEFHLNDGFMEALRAASRHGYEAVVITNQRCVALGLISEEDLCAMHDKFRALLRQDSGLDVLDVMYCPHGGDSCACRKPKPGMLIEAARRHGLSLSESWMVGDQERDITAGRNAGCRTILVDPSVSDTQADHHVAGMNDLVPLLDRVLQKRESRADDMAP